MNKPLTVVSTTNPLNFSESGWWGRILSEMKALITIFIGLLVVGCGKKAGTSIEHEFPEGFSAYWARAVSSVDTTATVTFHYE